MRKVVWERKPRVAPPYRSEAAQRILAGMRPTRMTRLTDPIVDQLDRFGEWVDGKTVTREVVDFDPRIQAVILGTFGAAGTLAFLYGGGIASMAIPYFVTVGGLLLAIVSYGAWNRSHPLPPIDERTTRHELIALLHGLAGGSLVFAGLQVIERTIDGGAGVSIPFSLFASVLTVFGVFMHRTGEKEAQPRRSIFGFALWAAGWLVGKAVEIGAPMWRDLPW